MSNRSGRVKPLSARLGLTELSPFEFGVGAFCVVDVFCGTALMMFSL